MDEQDKQTPPIKCSNCNKPMVEMLVCDYCRSLNPEAIGMDYFALLGLPRQFELDEETVRGKFLALNREAHPDFHADQSPEVQQLSLQMSSAINNAYRTLRDPYTRAAYLLELMGGKSSSADKSVPDGFLPTMMMLQEELEEAKTSGDHAEIERLRKVIRTQHDGLIRRISGLFAEMEEAAACEAVRGDLLGELGRQINAVSYVRKLLSGMK